MLAPAIEVLSITVQKFNVLLVSVQTLQVCRDWHSSVLFPSFSTKVTTYKHAFEMHYFDNCFSTVNMQHIVSFEVHSISTINLFLQNYTMSLPTVCVAWNFTAGKDTTYPLKLLNPIFLFPKVHIYVHSFEGTPFQQQSLLRGKIWWSKHTWRTPSANTINDIHNYPETKQLGFKMGDWTDFHAGLPPNLDWI